MPAVGEQRGIKRDQRGGETGEFTIHSPSGIGETNEQKRIRVGALFRENRSGGQHKREGPSKPFPRGREKQNRACEDEECRQKIKCGCGPGDRFNASPVNAEEERRRERHSPVAPKLSHQDE